MSSENPLAELKARLMAVIDSYKQFNKELPAELKATVTQVLGTQQTPPNKDRQTQTPAANQQPNQTTPADAAKPVTASKTISGSVGDKGDNKPEDVLLVKTLLNKFYKAFNIADTNTNTKVGPTTIGIIKKFQQEKVGSANPDGRIDVGGKSWKVLNGETPPAAANTDNAQNSNSSGGKMAHPNPGARMTSPYGMRIHPVTGKKKMHRGMDFAKGAGSPIYAAADGKVSHLYDEGGYGKWILLEHTNGYSTRYAHLSAYVAANGAQVKKGDVIGKEGNTGIGTGSHLHFEVRINGADVNPAPYISGSKTIP